MENINKEKDVKTDIKRKSNNFIQTSLHLQGGYFPCPMVFHSGNQMLSSMGVTPRWSDLHTTGTGKLLLGRSARRMASQPQFLNVFDVVGIKLLFQKLFCGNPNNCGAYGCGEGGYRFLVGKSKGRTPLGRPRRRCVDNIRMDFQEVGCGFIDWIGLAQDRDRWRTFVSAVMNLRVP